MNSNEIKIVISAKEKSDIRIFFAIFPLLQDEKLLQ